MEELDTFCMCEGDTELREVMAVFEELEDARENVELAFVEAERADCSDSLADGLRLQDGVSDDFLVCDGDRCGIAGASILSTAALTDPDLTEVALSTGFCTDSSTGAVK
jgi:hypothetical protein